ncbi:MAG: hypothetical protein R2764_18595 [Bacteroidales bacterium]
MIDKLKNVDAYKDLDYDGFLVPLVKVMKEQQHKLEEQNDLIADLMKRIEKLEKQ